MKPAFPAMLPASNPAHTSGHFRAIPVGGPVGSYRQILLSLAGQVAAERAPSALAASRTASFGAEKNLPIRGRAQGGEEGNLVIEEDPIDWTYRPADLQGIHGAFAVFVTGNSMEPKYKSQDLAYIHPTQRPRRGRFVLVETHNHGGFIKQFEGWKKDTLIVRQFNPAKELLFDRHEIRSVMVVIGSLDA